MLHTEKIEVEKTEKSPILKEFFSGLKIGFADIETTGLSPKTARVILGGVNVLEGVREDEDGEHVTLKLVCHEFFSNFGTKDDEKDLLLAYLEVLRGLDVIVTYNGEKFDVPFLFERFRKHKIDYFEGFPFNFDLYRMLNGFSSLRQVLPNLKQKTVESYFGLWPTRTDEISGEDSINLYYAYLSHKPGPGKDALKETIILHNSDDCMQLCRLSPIVKKTDFQKGLWQLGFPAGNLAVKKIEIKGEKLLASGVQRRRARDYRDFDFPGHPYSVSMNRSLATFEVEIPMLAVPAKAGMPRLLLIDLESFHFDYNSIKGLPYCENQYIIVAEGDEIAHKTVTAFIKVLLEDLDLRQD